MNEQPEYDSQSSEFIKLILDLLQVPVKIAKQTVSGIFVLALINLGSAVWLVFFIWHQFNLHPSLNTLIFIIVGFPAIALSKLYLTLKEIIGLPDRIMAFFHASTQKVSDLNQAQERLRTKLKDKDWRASDMIAAGKNVHSWFRLGRRLRDYFFLAHRLRDVQAIFSEFEGLATLTAGAMLLANPLFLVGVTVSTVVAIIWGLFALVTLFIYVL
jgi:hypothetical protein